MFNFLQKTFFIFPIGLKMKNADIYKFLTISQITKLICYSEKTDQFIEKIKITYTFSLSFLVSNLTLF